MGDQWNGEGFSERQEECRDRAREKREDLEGEAIPQWRKEQIIDQKYARCMQQYNGGRMGNPWEYGYPQSPPVIVVPSQPRHSDSDCTAGTGDCSWERGTRTLPPGYTPPVPGKEYDGPGR